MSYPYIGAVALGASKASSTITASVVDLTGAALGVQPTRTVINLGGGAFGLSVPDMPDGQTGWVLLQESGTTLAVLGVNPREVENADAKTSTRSSHAAADVWAVATRTLTAFTFSVDVATVGGATATLVTPPLDANVTGWKGGTPNDLVSGKVDANASVSLGSTAPAGWLNAAAFASGVLPTNFGVFSVDSNGRVDVGKVLGQAAKLADGTAQAGTSTTITLDPADTAGTDAYVNRTLTLTGGTGLGQSRVITAYNSATKVATVDPAWATTPDGTSTYDVGDTATAAGGLDAPGVRSAVGLASANLDTQLGGLPDATAARFGVAVTTAGTPNASNVQVTGSGLEAVSGAYTGSFLAFKAGATNSGVARKVTAHSYSAGTHTLTFSGATGAADAPWPAAPLAGEAALILGRG